MNKGKFVITFFASSTNDGLDLVRRVDNDEFKRFVDKRLANSLQSDVRSELRVIYPSDTKHNTIHFQIYQKKSDLVIFDGSIEEYENELLGDNYKCVPHAPYMNDNVLIVSRTVLPLNFIPHTTNVLPFGENFLPNGGNQLSPITSYDNATIYDFIKEQIILRIQNLTSNNSSQGKSDSSVKKAPQLYLSNGEKIAFISYRSYYYNHQCCGFDVHTLREYILDYHKRKNPEEKWKVIFYPPGGLSQDCPTEYLRWALSTYVDNVFIHVDEVWIFDTESIDEKSYWDSWFTQGEFLSLIKINQELSDCMPIVYLFNPHTGKSEELKSFPVLPDKESREISLLQANSDILWGDYAALRNVIYFLDDWKSYGRTRKALFGLLSKTLSLPLKIFFKGLPSQDYNSMSKAYAYQPEFLTNRVFSCTNCMNSGYNIDSFNNIEFIRQYIRIGDQGNPVAGFFVVNKEDFLEAIERGYVECPSCRKKIYMKRNPSQDFYLWKKWTKRTNSVLNDWYIEKVPAYSVMQHRVEDNH